MDKHKCLWYLIIEIKICSYQNNKQLEGMSNPVFADIMYPVVGYKDLFTRGVWYSTIWGEAGCHSPKANKFDIDI